MKILIWGFDVHTARYCESLLFTKHFITCTCFTEQEKLHKICTKYNIEFKKPKEILRNLKEFDVIIITCKKKELLQVVKIINNSCFKNIVIIEKPIANSLIESKVIIKYLINVKPYIAHTRLYQDNYIVLKENNLIEWPNIDKSKDFKLNTIINIFDFICCQTKSKNFSITRVDKYKDNILFDIICKNMKFKIKLYDVELAENKKLKVNGIEYNWPNYLITIGRMITDMLELNIDSKNNIEYSMKTIDLAEKILSKGESYE